MATVKELRQYGASCLEAAGVPNAAHDADELLAFALHVPRLALTLTPETISDGTRETYISLVKRRQEREPLQYIIGSVDFCGVHIVVDSRALIPRFETEMIVEALTRRFANHSGSISILDMCTGTGAIAVTLALKLRAANVTAVDISRDALSLARHNADINHARVTFIESDMFDNVPRGAKYHAITCNPPYIRTREIQTLEPEVLREPTLALDGGDDGLDFIRVFAKEARERLAENGVALVEIGHGQAAEAARIFAEYNNIRIEEDDAGIPRMLVAFR